LCIKDEVIPDLKEEDRIPSFQRVVFSFSFVIIDYISVHVEDFILLKPVQRGIKDFAHSTFSHEQTQ
jgi:hypothetical protein